VERRYQYRPWGFFLIAYVATWIPWLVGAYLGRQPGLEAYAPLLSLVGLLGPIGATLFMVLTSGSCALKCDFKDRLLNLRKIRPILAILAVVAPFAVICLSILLSLWLGESIDQFQLADSTQLLPMIPLAMILAPIMEETGWHGYGVDSLRANFGMMRATLLFAGLWCIWHAPLALISGTYQNAVAEMENKIFIVNFFVSIIIRETHKKIMSRPVTSTSVGRKVCRSKVQGPRSKVGARDIRDILARVSRATLDFLARIA